MNDRRLGCGAILVLTTIVLAACGDKGTTYAPIDSIEDFGQRLEDLRSSSHIPAITAVIAKDQEIVWAKAFGHADIAAQRPAADTTIYHLASLTKPFAGTVLLQLVEEGRVSLDASYGTMVFGRRTHRSSSKYRSGL